MSDLSTQLKDYFEELAPSIDLANVVDQAASSKIAARPRPRGWVLAAGVGLGTLVVIGGLAMLLGGPGGEVAGIIPRPDTPGPGDPPTSLPSAGFADLPGFEASVRYELDVQAGYPVDAAAHFSISYRSPDEFRREITLLQPPELDFPYGIVGDYVATDGQIPIFTGETTEEGEPFGPLVWANWAKACTTPLEATRSPEGLTTVVCVEGGDSQWVESGSTWAIEVDPITGLVHTANAELSEGPFKVAATRVQVLSITYTTQFPDEWFATPLSDPPGEFPNGSVAFTYVGDDGRVVAVSWFNETAWRWDYLEAGDTGLAAGSYHVGGRGALTLFSPETGWGSSQAFPDDGRLALVEWSCDETGTCQNPLTDDEGFTLTCEIGHGGTIVDRPVLRYDCQPTIWLPEQTLWIDQEFGYVLKSDHHEVIAIDLTPVFDASIFETG